jgi:hypothetical protein
MGNRNLYSVLGVNENASKKQIRSRYIKLAKLYHPDRFRGGDEEIKIINLAYWTLHDDERRQEYDLRLRFEQLAEANIADEILSTEENRFAKKLYDFDFLSKRKVKVVILSGLVIVFCLTGSISDIGDAGARDLLFGVAFAAYFLALIAALQII